MNAAERGHNDARSGLQEMEPFSREYAVAYQKVLMSKSQLSQSLPHAYRLRSDETGEEF
jgi:hypothetical protein